MYMAIFTYDGIPVYNIVTMKYYQSLTNICCTNFKSKSFAYFMFSPNVIQV